MIESITHDKDDFPHIKWTQKVASGSVGYFMKETFLMFFIGGGVIGGFVGDNFVAGTLCGMAIGAVGWVGSMAYSNPRTQRDHDNAAMPTFTKEEGFAQVVQGSANQLLFRWAQGKGGGSVPLSDVAAFEFGTYDEWFADPSAAAHTHKYFVIIINTPRGIERVATHSGSKADIAHLHRVLTDEFVTKRGVFLPKPAGAKPGSPLSASAGRRAAAPYPSASKPSRL